jgi:hypothetical protein
MARLVRLEVVRREVCPGAIDGRPSSSPAYLVADHRQPSYSTSTKQLPVFARCSELPEDWRRKTSMGQEEDPKLTA